MNERGCAPIKLEKQAVGCRKRSLQPRNSFWHYPSILRHSRVSCQQEIQRGQQATVLPAPPTYQAGPEAERCTELHSRSFSAVKQLSVQVHTQPRTITPSRDTHPRIPQVNQTSSTVTTDLAWLPNTWQEAQSPALWSAFRTVITVAWEGKRRELSGLRRVTGASMPSLLPALSPRALTWSSAGWGIC